MRHFEDYEARKESACTLQAFTSFHPCGVHIRTMQSKHRIDCELSPPQGQLSARTTEGKPELIKATQTEAVRGCFFASDIGRLYSAWRNSLS
jgi:hypothetical protein